MACNSSTIYGTIWCTKNRRKKHDMARRNAEKNTIIMLHEWMQKSAAFGARRNAGKKHYVSHEDKQKRAQFGHEEIKKPCAAC